MPTFPLITTFPSGSRIVGQCTIYFLKQVFWEHVLFSKTGWLSKKFLLRSQDQSQSAILFHWHLFHSSLDTPSLYGCDWNIELANKVLWKNRNFWPTQYINLNTLNLGSEAFHWAHSAYYLSIRSQGRAAEKTSLDFCKYTHPGIPAAPTFWPQKIPLSVLCCA